MKQAGVVATALMMASASAQAQSVEVFVFGDSLSDKGNMYQLTDESYPPSGQYDNGRASNGQVWAEKLGYNLKNAPGGRIKAADQKDGFDFAHFGATVIRRDGLQDGQHLGYQVSKFRTMASNGKINVGSSDQIAVWAGTNDYVAYGETRAKLVAERLAKQGNLLQQVAGSHVFMMGLPDLGNFPIAYEWNSRDAWSQLVAQHNTALASDVAGYGGRLHYIDMKSLFDDMQDNPAAYGFEIVRPGSETSGYCLGDGLVLDGCPKTYMFYDAIHPARRTHAHIASYVGAVMDGVLAAPAYQDAGRGRASGMMAVQSRALSGDIASLASFGSVEFGGLRLFATERARDLVGDDAAGPVGDGLALAGAEMALGDGWSVAALVSRRGNGRALLDGPVSAQAATGWAMEAGRELGALTLSIEGAGITQQLDSYRVTGFERDPLVTAKFEQAQMTAFASASYALEAGPVTVSPFASFGYSTVATGPINEQGQTSLVSANTPAFSRGGYANAAGVRAEMLRSKTLWGLGFSHAVSEDGVSAWGLSEADLLTGQDASGARVVDSATLSVETDLESGWHLAGEAAYGVSRDEDRAGLRARVTRSF